MSSTPPLDKETFLAMSFYGIASEEEKTFSDPLISLLCSENLSISNALDQTPLQESWSWRNSHLCRELAKMLIGDKGELKKELLSQAVRILEDHLFSLGPNRSHDYLRQKHLLKILHSFHENPKLVSALQQISRPVRHQLAERLIRETLFLKEKEPLTDAHARMAALSALLTSLRQNVGSCFATAPAILIQQEQPFQLLADIAQLFGVGALKRTFEGVEYNAPLSVSWGAGDLFRPFMLMQLGEDPWMLLSTSPGIQAAFEAVGVLKNKQIQKECEGLLKGAFSHIKDPFLILDSHQVIQNALLYFFKISKEDVEYYQVGPIRGAAQEVVIQAPSSRSGKALACIQYLKAFDLAKAAFKAITDNALLKAWEFTLASLSESKSDFAKWNLYASLGLNPQEPHGIGAALYARIQQEVEKINEEIGSLQSQYDHLFATTKSLEGRLQIASSESEVNWVRAEYRMRKGELDRILIYQDDAYEKGKKLTHLFPFLFQYYGKKFSEYFQEVYDAEMHDISSTPYDDSPAGFRLLYKHGRANTSLWTLIHTSSEYIQALSAFFVATEIDLAQQPEVKGLERNLSDLTTTILMTIKTTEFLESSFFRLAKAYREPMIKNPLENQERVGRKPWSYVSGGTMETLVSCYYGNPRKPKEAKRWVESELELLVFYLDTLKELPTKTQKLFLEDQSRSMLAFSPTHAFLLKPGWPLFRTGWENREYTYTWVRDHWIIPQQNFVHSNLLGRREVEFLMDEILKTLPAAYRAVGKQVMGEIPYSMHPAEFREYLFKRFSYEKWLQTGERLRMLGEEIDSILFSSLPLFYEDQLRERLETLFDALDIEPNLRVRIFEIYKQLEATVGRYQIFSAKRLREIAKGLLILALQKTRGQIPYHQMITKAMQKSGLAYPTPILFADTNWVKNYFGFVVSPGSQQLELWRFDDCGSEGRPMSIWKHYLNGSDRKEWGLYIAPHEYVM